MQALKLTSSFSLPLLPLILLLLLPLWPSQLALALHTVCSWQPGKGSPETYHYSKLCDADLTNDTNNSADFKCVAGQVGNQGVVVASWGKRASEILEWYAPCHQGGYGIKSDGSCYAPHFAICLGDSDNGNCYAMASGDDCQWPQPITRRFLPSFVTVWFETA